eukprot:jgi/Ulvmu1/5323/UM022_0117.1
MSDSDADEYVYYGTPLEQEQTSTYYASRQVPKQASQVVALPVHQQEVRDAQGRQRLHGAFTGGFSAGFFNTVGSEEGFQPATFTSSRKSRAGQRQQEVSDFLDEDELEDLQKKGLQTRSEYDTFASAPGAAAQAEAAQHAASRHGHEALNLFPQEALRPVVSSIGIKLLQQMGWRQGRGLGFQETQALSQMGYDVSAVEPGTDAPTQRLQRRKWGPLAGLQAHNTRVVRPRPKDDVHGLGFDPYANAAEFRTARKQLRDGPAQQPRRDRHGVRQRGVAFAASVIEESDVYGGDLADYVDEDEERANLHFEVVSSDEDGGGRGGRGDSPRRLEAAEAVPMIKARQGTMGLDSFIEGFVRGAMAEPPAVQGTLVPARGIKRTYHRFVKPCGQWYGGPRKEGAGEGGVDETAEPPADPDEKKRIDVLAAAVARGGDEMLAFVRDKHQGDDQYAFLHGGDGAAYFRRRVTAIRTALVRANAAVLHHTAAALRGPQAHRSGPAGGPPRLTVEQRAKLLQEPQLPGGQAPAAHRRAAANAPAAAAGHAQAAASAAATREALLARAESAGLLRKGGALASRFVKAGALAPEAGGWTSAEAEAAKQPAEAAAEAAEKPPTRTVHEWRPDPLLCKRFNVPDPFKDTRDRPQQAAGSMAQQLLGVPSEERGNVYSAALPEFMRPAAGTAQQAQQGGWEEELPPPPPVGGAAAGLPAEPPPAAGMAGGQDYLSQVADEILASVDADFAKKVEEAAPAPEEVPLDKPINVFQAIFADSESEEEEDAGAAAAPAAAGAPAAAPGSPAPPAAAGADAAAALADAARAGGGAQAAAAAAQRPRNAAAMLQGAQARLVELGRQAAAAAPAAPAAAGAAARERSPEHSGASGGSVSSDDEGTGDGRRDGRADRGGSCERQHRSRPKRRRESDDSEGDEQRQKRTKRSKSERKRDKEKERKRRHKEKRRHDDVADRAAQALKDEAMQQKLSTEEIIAMAKELKRRNKERSREKEKHHKHRHQKSSSSKHRRVRSRSPSV